MVTRSAVRFWTFTVHVKGPFSNEAGGSLYPIAYARNSQDTPNYEFYLYSNQYLTVQYHDLNSGRFPYVQWHLPVGLDINQWFDIVITGKTGVNNYVSSGIKAYVNGAALALQSDDPTAANNWPFDDFGVGFWARGHFRHNGGTGNYSRAEESWWDVQYTPEDAASIHGLRLAGIPLRTHLGL